VRDRRATLTIRRVRHKSRQPIRRCKSFTEEGLASRPAPSVARASREAQLEAFTGEPAGEDQSVFGSMGPVFREGDVPANKNKSCAGLVRSFGLSHCSFPVGQGERTVRVPIKLIG